MNQFSESIINKIKAFVIKNELDEAIEFLLENSNKSNRSVSIAQRWNHLKDQNVKGVLTNEEFVAKRNKIGISILNLLNPNPILQEKQYIPEERFNMALRYCDRKEAYNKFEELLFDENNKPRIKIVFIHGRPKDQYSYLIDRFINSTRDLRLVIFPNKIFDRSKGSDLRKISPLFMSKPSKEIKQYIKSKILFSLDQVPRPKNKDPENDIIKIIKNSGAHFVVTVFDIQWTNDNTKLLDSLIWYYEILLQKLRSNEVSILIFLCITSSPSQKLFKLFFPKSKRTSDLIEKEINQIMENRNNSHGTKNSVKVSYSFMKLGNFSKIDIKDTLIDYGIWEYLPNEAIEYYNELPKIVNMEHFIELKRKSYSSYNFGDI